MNPDDTGRDVKFVDLRHQSHVIVVLLRRLITKKRRISRFVQRFLSLDRSNSTTMRTCNHKFQRWGQIRVTTSLTVRNLSVTKLNVREKAKDGSSEAAVYGLLDNCRYIDREAGRRISVCDLARREPLRYSPWQCNQVFHPPAVVPTSRRIAHVRAGIVRFQLSPH